jgi:hypothetical protein
MSCAACLVIGALFGGSFGYIVAALMNTAAD